jgi:presenilin 1
LRSQPGPPLTEVGCGFFAIDGRLLRHSSPKHIRTPFSGLFFSVSFSRLVTSHRPHFHIISQPELTPQNPCAIQEEAARRLRLREAQRQQRAEQESRRKEEERELDLKYDADSVLALIKPVSACMIVVIATIRSVTYFSQNDTQFACVASAGGCVLLCAFSTIFLPPAIILTAVISTPPPHSYTPFESGSDESDGQKFGGALLNALIIIGIVVVMTCVLLVLYMYKYYKVSPGLSAWASTPHFQPAILPSTISKRRFVPLLLTQVIHGWLMLSSLLLLFFFSYQYIEQVLLAYNKSIDWITLAVVVWNFGTGGFIAIHWRGPLRLQQFYLVAVSALMALVLIKNVRLCNMPPGCATSIII